MSVGSRSRDFAEACNRRIRLGRRRAGHKKRNRTSARVRGSNSSRSAIVDEHDVIRVGDAEHALHFEEPPRRGSGRACFIGSDDCIERNTCGNQRIQLGCEQSARSAADDGGLDAAVIAA